MAVRLSALRAGQPLPPGRFLVLISVTGSVDPRTIVRLKELDKLKKICLIGTRTRDLPACCIVPQPTMLCYRVPPPPHHIFTAVSANTSPGYCRHGRRFLCQRQFSALNISGLYILLWNVYDKPIPDFQASASVKTSLTWCSVSLISLAHRIYSFTCHAKYGFCGLYRSHVTYLSVRTGRI
jgi:hypothetical protein